MIALAPDALCNAISASAIVSTNDNFKYIISFNINWTISHQFPIGRSCYGFLLLDNLLFIYPYSIINLVSEPESYSKNLDSRLLIIQS
nr:MAG TPA: hypothetical protein [Caudoviricetes sp.]